MQNNTQSTEGLDPLQTTGESSLDSAFCSVYDLWAKLGDAPTDNDDCLEMPFLNFPEGTHREDVWHWFEEQFDVRVTDLMYARA